MFAILPATQRSTTGQAYMGISKAINTLTGGSDYEAGKLSPTPERVRYLAQTVGGGVLREIEKTVNASTAAERGDKVKMSQIPVAGRFYGEVDSDQVQMSRYYDSSNKLKMLESSFKAMTKAGDADAARKFLDEHPELVMARTAATVQQKVAALNKLAVQTVSDPSMMKQIDEARVANMVALNQAIKAQEDAAGKVTLAQKLRTAVTSRTGEAEAAQ